MPNPGKRRYIEERLEDSNWDGLTIRQAKIMIEAEWNKFSAEKKARYEKWTGPNGNFLACLL